MQLSSLTLLDSWDRLMYRILSFILKNLKCTRFIYSLHENEIFYQQSDHKWCKTFNTILLVLSLKCAQLIEKNFIHVKV